MDGGENRMVGRRRMERKNNEREVLVERATMVLWRNLVGKFPQIHKNDPS